MNLFKKISYLIIVMIMTFVVLMITRGGLFITINFFIQSIFFNYEEKSE